MTLSWKPVLHVADLGGEERVTVSQPAPTWQTIKALFTDRDVSCMAPRGYVLDEYEAVKAEAEAVYESVESASMPPGRPWSGEQLAAFRQWIDAGCPEGSAAPEPAELPTPEEERQGFHRLMNIEDHRDFEATAKRWAHAYLAAAKFDDDPLYALFEYSLQAFRDRMKAIYDVQLLAMHEPHSYDQPLF